MQTNCWMNLLNELYCVLDTPHEGYLISLILGYLIPHIYGEWYLQQWGIRYPTVEGIIKWYLSWLIPLYERYSIPLIMPLHWGYQMPLIEGILMPFIQGIEYPEWRAFRYFVCRASEGIRGHPRASKSTTFRRVSGSWKGYPSRSSASDTPFWRVSVIPSDTLDTPLGCPSPSFRM